MTCLDPLKAMKEVCVVGGGGGGGGGENQK